MVSTKAYLVILEKAYISVHLKLFFKNVYKENLVCQKCQLLNHLSKLKLPYSKLSSYEM